MSFEQFLHKNRRDIKLLGLGIAVVFIPALVYLIFDWLSIGRREYSLVVNIRGAMLIIFIRLYIVQLIKKIRLLRQPDLARQAYIEASDER